MSAEEANLILRLPAELRSSILSCCDSAAILSLCLTSRAMHQTCIPSLFHAIDLSIHNRPEWARDSTYINVDVPADYIDRKLDEQDRLILHRQKRLGALLATSPSLATRTRVLKWTVLQPLESYFPDPRVMNNDFWNMVESFDRVTEIDIAFMRTWRELSPPPPSTFKTATSISLAGVVSHAVLASIFTSIDASRLRHLRLNNLQTFAEPREVLQSLNQDEISAYRRNRPGAACGWLSLLTGRCTSLRSFHFLTTAEFVDKSSEIHVPSSWSDEVQDEHRRYAELGAFIAHAKPNLRELIFEHGPDIDYFSSHTSGRHTIRAFEGPNHDSPLPMDVYFDRHLLPVLASGPWPHLQSITVRGIGQWKPIHPWKEGATPEELRYLHTKTRYFRDRAELVWEAVGAGKLGVEAVIEDEASRPFYRFQADKRRNMTGVRAL